MQNVTTQVTTIGIHTGKKTSAFQVFVFCLCMHTCGSGLEV